MILCYILYSVSQKNPPWGFLAFFPNGWEFFYQFFTHLLHITIYARMQIFIQLSLTVTKLCHIECDHPANFYISLELLNLFIEQMTSLLTSCYIRHVCWHYKSVCSLLINFHEWVKYPTTTNCAKDQCPPNSADLTQPTRLPCVLCDASSISQTSFKATDHPRAKKCTAADLWWLATDNDQQESLAIAKMTARCALCIPTSYAP